MFPRATFKVWTSTTSGRISDESGLKLIRRERGSGSELIPNEIADQVTDEIAFGYQDMTVSFQDRAMVRRSKLKNKH